LWAGVQPARLQRRAGVKVVEIPNASASKKIASFFVA